MWKVKGHLFTSVSHHQAAKGKVCAPSLRKTVLLFHTWEQVRGLEASGGEHGEGLGLSTDAAKWLSPCWCLSSRSSCPLALNSTRLLFPVALWGREVQKKRTVSVVPGTRQGNRSDFVIPEMLRVASRISEKTTLSRGLLVKTFMLVLSSSLSITLYHSQIASQDPSQTPHLTQVAGVAFGFVWHPNAHYSTVTFLDWEVEWSRLREAPNNMGRNNGLEAEVQYKLNCFCLWLDHVVDSQVGQIFLSLFYFFQNSKCLEYFWNVVNSQ